MTDVFERLHKLKGKTREEIVAGSAHAEWATTDLFVQNTGRQGTGKLAEIVLAKCGQSEIMTKIQAKVVINMTNNQVSKNYPTSIL